MSFHVGMYTHISSQKLVYNIQDMDVVQFI